MPQPLTNGAYTSEAILDKLHILERVVDVQQRELHLMQAEQHEVAVIHRSVKKLDRKVSAMLHAFQTLGLNCAQALEEDN
jgi:hypothetical protein